MKPDIHPKIYQTQFACACGAKFSAESTVEGPVRADVCAACHPFFTGKQKLVDAAGRIEKFRKRYDNLKK